MTLAAPGPDEVTWRSTMGTLRRTGTWHLPRLTRLKVFMGDAKLDLRRATVSPGPCLMEIAALMGDVVITTPDGFTVRDELRGVMGDVKLLGLPESRPGDHLLVLRGRVIMGTIKVIGPRHESLAKKLGITA